MNIVPVDDAGLGRPPLTQNRCCAFVHCFSYVSDLLNTENRLANFTCAQSLGLTNKLILESLNTFWVLIIHVLCY